MDRIVKAVKAVGEASGTLAKLQELSKNRYIPGFKEVMRFIYNPYNKTGIASAKLSKALSTFYSLPGITVTWQEALEYFSHHNTGSDADLAYASAFICSSEDLYGKDAKDLAIAIVTQDLKIGVSVTSLNKVYGKDFIPKTGCMLGTLFGDVGQANVQWPCVVTEKLDGIRRILIKEKGECRFYSRSGHEDTGLIEIAKEAAYLPDNHVYDGELLAAGDFKDNIALRQATNSIASGKGPKTGLTFNVFDMLPVSEFYAGVSEESALNRKILLGAVLRDEGIQHLDDMWGLRIAAFGVEEPLEFIKPVPVLGLAHNLAEVTPIVQNIWLRGGEGVMLNTVYGKYEIKRSKHLLKVKHTEEVVLPIVDVLEGTGKYEEATGALVVNYKGSFVGVGSGLTDAQRYDIWEHKERYIGRSIEIETFGESVNAQGYVSLNCPIFKRFVGEVE